tara:strand:+ start:135 stop:272 length:138 start_codon:yes stop_codon:yes gene_type:complete
MSKRRSTLRTLDLQNKEKLTRKMKKIINILKIQKIQKIQKWRIKR